MKWYKIEISTDKDKSEEISDFLIEYGCNGLEIIDPIEIKGYIASLDTEEYADNGLVPDIKGNVSVIGYVDISYDLANIKRDLEVYNKKITIVDDKEWENNWKKYYHEFLIGKKLHICPSWITPKNIQNRKVIYLDPGMAFGTGEHETTYLCAKILESRIKEGDSVLDVGTGSGILSIISAKLGASQIKAVDIDEVAIRVANENLEKNDIKDIVDLEKCEIGELPIEKYDIIVANIVTKVLIEIKEEIRKRIKPGGTVILTGIIREKYPELLKEYVTIGFKLKNKLTKKEWVAVVFDA